MVPSVAPQELGFAVETLNVGNGFTVILPADAVLEQPVVVFVKVIFAVPRSTPVTTPPLVTVATVPSLLDQLPPVDGVKFKVSPTHTLPLFGTVTVGVGFTVTVRVAVAFEQPPVPVTV